MPLIIFPSATYYSGGSSTSGDIPHSNIATLNMLSTNAQGNLTFNGQTVGDTAREVAYNVTISNAHLAQKSIQLPDDCDASRAITLSLNGILFPRGDAWEGSEQNYPLLDAITWQNLALDCLIQTGDKVCISYYKKI